MWTECRAESDSRWLSSLPSNFTPIPLCGPFPPGASSAQTGSSHSSLGICHPKTSFGLSALMKGTSSRLPTLLSAVEVPCPIMCVLCFIRPPPLVRRQALTLSPTEKEVTPEQDRRAVLCGHRRCLFSQSTQVHHLLKQAGRQNIMNFVMVKSELGTGAWSHWLI